MFPLWGLIAAAGTSARMGFSKSLLGTQTGGLQITAWGGHFRACGVSRVLCTLPDQEPEGLRRHLEKAGLLPIMNAHMSRGLLGSVQSAVSMLPTEFGLVMTPVDVPAAQGLECVRALVRVWTSQRDHVVRPWVGEVPGHPVVLPPAVVQRIRALGEGMSVRDALEGASEIRVPWGNSEVCRGVNTPEEAARVSPPLVRVVF